MQLAVVILLLTGVYPLWQAWQANRQTALAATLIWAFVAWAGWLGLGVAQLPSHTEADLEVLRYVALCLTCCVGVAVLGARRPIVAAWNFVVLGLLAVLLLPLAERLILGAQSLSWVRLVFIGATLALMFFNYLPTNMTMPAFAFAFGCALEFTQLIRPEQYDVPPFLGLLCLGLVPWMAYLCWVPGTQPPSEFDSVWRDFRNRFGVVWAQRVREQFNRAAANAGWPAHLYWQGLFLQGGMPKPEPDIQQKMVDTLRAMLKRFGEEKLGG